jgi:hypothetical protein
MCGGESGSSKAKQEGEVIEPVEEWNGELSGAKEERIRIGERRLPGEVEEERINLIREEMPTKGSWKKDGRETAAIFVLDIVLELGVLYHRKGAIRERTRVRMRMKIKTNCAPQSDSLDQRFQCNNAQMCVTRMHACMHACIMHPRWCVPDCHEVRGAPVWADASEHIPDEDDAFASS